jgi:hypothetical protein
MGAGGMVDVKQLAEPLSLDLHGAPLNIPRPLAIELDDLGRRMGRNIDGVLGGRIFKKYVVRVDYSAKTIDLIDPTSFDAAKAGTETPVRLGMGGIPQIDGHVTLPDGRQLSGSFILDSGATATVALNKPFVDKHNVLDSVQDPLRITFHGASHELPNLLARFAQLRFAGFVVEEPLARLTRSASGVLSQSSFAGLIGARALQRFTVTWDLARSRMFLKPNEHYKDADRMIGSGARFIVAENDLDQFVVREVLRASSAAEQGVRAGDRLLAIGEHQAADLSLPEINRIMRQEGQTARLYLARGGETFEIPVTPRDLI